MNSNDKIKALRKQKQLSQDELARLTGYTDRSSIAKIEAGQVELTESKILSFAQALGVSPSYLMGITDTAPTPTPTPALELTQAEAQLVTDYRDASDEIRSAAATMLHNSAETNRKEATSPAQTAG